MFFFIFYFVFYFWVGIVFGAQSVTGSHLICTIHLSPPIQRCGYTSCWLGRVAAVGVGSLIMHCQHPNSYIKRKRESTLSSMESIGLVVNIICDLQRIQTSQSKSNILRDLSSEVASASTLRRGSPGLFSAGSGMYYKSTGNTRSHQVGRTWVSQTVSRLGGSAYLLTPTSTKQESFTLLSESRKSSQC